MPMMLPGPPGSEKYQSQIQNTNEAYDRMLKSGVKYRLVIDNASLKKQSIGEIPMTKGPNPIQTPSANDQIPIETFEKPRPLMTRIRKSALFIPAISAVSG